MLGELLYYPGQQMACEAHRRRSHWGAAESTRSGVMYCCGAWCLGPPTDTKINVYKGVRACGQAAATSCTGQLGHAALAESFVIVVHGFRARPLTPQIYVYQEGRVSGVAAAKP